MKMKKILTIFALLLGLSTVPANAKTAPVQALQDFSISNPSQTLLIKMLANVQLNKDTMLHEGFYVLGCFKFFICLYADKVSKFP